MHDAGKTVLVLALSATLGAVLIVFTQQSVAGHAQTPPAVQQAAPQKIPLPAAGAGADSTANATKDTAGHPHEGL